MPIDYAKRESTAETEGYPIDRRMERLRSLLKNDDNSFCGGADAVTWLRLITDRCELAPQCGTLSAARQCLCQFFRAIDPPQGFGNRPGVDRDVACFHIRVKKVTAKPV